MSGPNDSGGGDTPTGDFKLPGFEAAAPAISPKYRLRLHWETPRLQWSPVLASLSPPPDRPEFLTLDDPFAAVGEAERYILSGAMLFDMRRLNFDVIDKAFLAAPTAWPSLLPSFAQMQASQNDAFYRRLGRPAPLFGAPLAPAPLLSPPMTGPQPPSPFYKLPDPAALLADPAAPKAGQVGDILKALMGLPFVQVNINKAQDEGLRQLRLLKTNWDDAPWRDRIPAIVIAAPIAASVIATVLGVDGARHFAFNRLKGVDIPAPFVPGLSLQIDDFGKADPFLLGAGAADGHRPQSVQIGFKLDVLKAIPAIRKVF
jgi:hypothetical protein